MIPEREREALMRLTMCAREECRICMFQKRCDFDFQYELATKNMNILADALRKTEPQNCETCEHWTDTEDGCADRHGCQTEPSTDGYMTKEQTKEYNDMLKEHSTVIGNITDCPWK